MKSVTQKNCTKKICSFNSFDNSRQHPFRVIHKLCSALKIDSLPARPDNCTETALTVNNNSSQPSLGRITSGMRIYEQLSPLTEDVPHSTRYKCRKDDARHVCGQSCPHNPSATGVATFLIESERHSMWEKTIPAGHRAKKVNDIGDAKCCETGNQCNGELSGHSHDHPSSIYVVELLFVTANITTYLTSWDCEW
jgi:hypothetical protein